MKKTFVVFLSAIAVLSWAPVIALGAGLLFVDDNGNVGIGNITPQHRLDVSGAIYSRLVSASSTIDWNAGNVQAMTLTGSTTLTFSGGQAGGEYTVILNQDGTGNRNVTWPGSVKWLLGIAPQLATRSNETDVIKFVYDGTHYLGASAVTRAAPFVPTLTNDLISYWKFDQTSGSTAFDSVGSNSFSANGSAGFTSPGKINYGSQTGRSGSAGFWTKSSPSSMPFGNGDFTVSGWFYPTSVVGSGALYGMWRQQGAAGMYWRNLSGTPQLWDSETDFTVNYTFTINTWYHVVFVHTASTGKDEFYVNGSSVGSGTGNTLTTSSNPFVIGNDFDNEIGNDWDGKIDEVGVWDRALSSTEISELYNSGSGLQYPF